MDLRLVDRVAYVAGSSRGIGFAIAQTFLEEGARVVLSGRDQSSLDKAMEAFAQAHGSHRVLSFCGDLADPHFSALTLQQTADHFGRIDCLVANVGAGTDVSGWDVSSEEWQRVFMANFWISQRLAHQAIPWLLAAGGGNIIFISSLAGVEEIGAPVSYATTKGALNVFAKSLARMLGPLGIRVNVIAPGNIIFPESRWEAKLAARREEITAMIHHEVPLGRFGAPKEIADAVVFLASERASFITGACLLVDGGQSRSL